MPFIFLERSLPYKRATRQLADPFGHVEIRQPSGFGLMSELMSRISAPETCDTQRREA
jgi:hypothetical protein